MHKYRAEGLSSGFLRRITTLLLAVCLLAGLLACGDKAPGVSTPGGGDEISSTSGGGSSVGASTSTSGMVPNSGAGTGSGSSSAASNTGTGSASTSKTVSGTKKTTATTARTTTRPKPVDVTGTVKVPAEGGYATGGDTNNPGHQKAICQIFKAGSIQKLNKLKVNYDDSQANSGSIKTGYLLEEEFMGWGLSEGLVVNGWDVDDAGGGVCSSVYSHFNVVDNSTGKSVTMKREFTQLTSGTFAIEISTGVDGKGMGDTWFSFNNDGKTVVAFGFDINGYMAVKTDSTAAKPLCKYQDDYNYGVKVVGDLATGKLSVWIDGICYASDVAFSGRRLDNLQVKTSVGGTGMLCLNYIGIYKGYIYNENFITALSGYVPDDWQVAGEESASVAILESETRPNVFSMLLDDDTGTKNVSLYRPFAKTSGDIQVDFKFYAPEEGRDGLVFRLMNGKNTALCLFVQYGNLYAQDKAGKVYQLYKLTPNVWYTVQVEVDASAKTAEVRLNYKARATDIKIGAASFDGISFATTKLQLSYVYLDDIQVTPVYPLPADYVPKPVKADNGNYDIGVLRCDLWKTGDHLGWDYLNGLEDNVRRPITGWYDDGNPELADWENKYMAEHGIDFFLSCWYGPHAGSTGSGQAIKSPLHGESLHNGYFNSQYSDMVDFAIVVAFEFTSLEDWKENIVPFMVEYYLKDYRYKVIDNRPVIAFLYYDMLLRSFGSENNLKVGLAYLRQACKKLGYDDAYLLIETPALAKENNVEANRLGLFDYSCAYAMSSLSNSPSTMLAGNVDTQKYDGAKGLIASVSVGFDYYPWDKSNNNPLISAAAFEESCRLVKERYMAGFDEDSLQSHVLLVDNWNENAEGHFINPTGVCGYGYLEAIRKVFCAPSSSKHTDVKPSKAQRDRVAVLYPQNRVVTQEERYRYNVPVSNCKTVLKKWTFDDGAENYRPISADFGQVAAGSGSLLLMPHGRYLTRIFCDNFHVDAAQAKYLRIRTVGDTSDVGGRAYYGFNGEDINWNYNSRPMTVVKGDGYTEYLVDLCNGTCREGVYFKDGGQLTYLQLWFGTMDKMFAIDSIEILG